MARPAPESVQVARPRFPDTAEPSIIVDAQNLLYTYVRFVRRHRLMLISVPLLCAATAAAIVLSGPRMYEGQLTVTVSRGSEEASTVVASFKPYLENHRVLEDVIQEFKLDQAPHHITRTAFLRNFYVVEPIRNTNLVTIRLRLQDPHLVAPVLNRIGERALALLDQTASELGTQTQRALKREREEAAARVEQAATELQNFRTAHQIELLRKDADSALELRGALMSLSVRIAEQRSRLLQSEAELKTHDRSQQFSRTLDDGQLMVESARERQEGGSGSMASMTLRSEYANPVYQDLAGSVAKARIELASLVEQRRQLVETRGIGADKLPLLSKLYAAERALAELERRQAVVNGAYSEIATKYELARSESLGRSAQLVIIDPALPPDGPTPRGLLTTSAMAVAAGLMLALLLILFQRPASTYVDRREAV